MRNDRIRPISLVGAGVSTARRMVRGIFSGRVSPSPTFLIQRWFVSVGADNIRPPLDLHRAGGAAKQAAVGSAEGGAVKQSEAILDGVFLSSPILSFARKRKNGKKKKRVLYVGFRSS